jgi:hypothetical protein
VVPFLMNDSVPAAKKRSSYVFPAPFAFAGVMIFMLNKACPRAKKKRGLFV